MLECLRKNAKCLFKQKTELRYPALRIKNRGGRGEVQPHSAPVAFIACYNVNFWIVPNFTMLFNLDYARNLAREGKFREALSVYSVSARQSGPNMDVVR